MRSRYFVTLLFFMLLCHAVVAQRGAGSALCITPSKLDYGSIAEDGGVVMAYIEATNCGDTPIYIIKVHTSCGCTSVDYPREAVAPRQSVRLGIAFDPMNRPGRFERDIAVEVSDSREYIPVAVRGYVVPRLRSVDEVYPFDMGGGLRLETTSRAFGYIEQGCRSSEQIPIVNTSERDITLGVEPLRSSGYLTLAVPEVVAARATAAITLTYTIPEGGGVYGTMADEIYLVVDGARSRYRLTAECVAVDNFSLVDDISRPIADISKNIIKFGEVNCHNSLLRGSVTLTNSGSSELYVRSVESSSEAVTCAVVPSGGVAPGQSVELSITLDCSKIASSDELITVRLRLITNDPMRPLQTLKVTAIPMWGW